MGTTWDTCSLAALALCLGCGSSEGNGKAAEADTTQTATTSPSSTSTGSGGTDDGTGADSTAAATNTGGSGSTGAGAGDTTASANTSTSGAGTGGQISWPHTETHACLAYVLAFCEQTERCDRATDVLDCYASNSVRCPDLLFAPGSTRTVNGTFDCAEEWRTQSCEIPTPECATAGTLADGEACVTGIQCASRLCSGSTELCGSCTPSADLGEPCDDALGPSCVPGLLCDPTDLVCFAPSPGDPMDLGDECEPTASNCYPNDCRADDAGVYRCQPYPTLGQDCSEPLTCAFGDSYCDLTQVCLEFPAAGDPCGVDGFTGMAQWCAKGLVCDRTSEPAFCRALPGAGEPCDGVCQDGLICNSQVCQRPRFFGETCNPPQDGCIGGDCVEGTCVVPEAESIFAERCAE